MHRPVLHLRHSSSRSSRWRDCQSLFVGRCIFNDMMDVVISSFGTNPVVW